MYKKEKKKENSHSHFICSITPVVYRSRHSHNERGHTVAHQVEVLPAWVLALKHLHQHDVELHALQEHPGEGGQEEEV